MIYGIQSSQPASGSSGAPDYSDATAVADFVLGIYQAGATSYTLNQVVSEPQYITANGLFFDWNTAQEPMDMLPNAIFDAIVDCNWTLVFEWEELELGTIMRPLFLQDDATVGTEDLWIHSDDTEVFVFDQPSPGTSREAGQVSGVPARPGIRRIAITRTPSKLVTSLNGSAIVSDTTPSLSPFFEHVGLGGEVIFALPQPLELMGYVRRIIVYPAQADAALPGLSTR